MSSWLHDLMIGHHQGRAQRHEDRARYHREAELRWKARADDPYECRASYGRTFDSAQAAGEWVRAFVAEAVERGAERMAGPEVFRCYEGHWHAKPNLRFENYYCVNGHRHPGKPSAQRYVDGLYAYPLPACPGPTEGGL